jgi:hypothetical protein
MHGDIDRHAHVMAGPRPDLRLFHRQCQHCRRELRHEAVLRSQRDELIRVHQSIARMSPPDQAFDADERTRAQRHLRLVIVEQLAFENGRSQLRNAVMRAARRALSGLRRCIAHFHTVPTSVAQMRVYRNGLIEP